MKIKKFNNLWTMGLIIFGAILIVLYLAKLIFPEFVISLAEIEPIVRFGNYVDTHEWAYYLFSFVVSFAVGYFYCGACCRKKKLKFIDMCMIALMIILLFVIERFLPQYYAGLNMILMLVVPALICYFDKKQDIKHLYSTISTFSIYYLAQFISLEIRNMSQMITFANSATFTILVIDAYIWAVLLYNYFNYKEAKNYG